MSYEATTSDLLYITNYSNVLVFTYPQGKLVGTLKGFYSAVGECVDGHGDVFITNFKPVTVYEYAHGGKKPIAEFPTKKAGTVGCAINPVNGDLAITGQTSYVEIFKGAKGKPIIMRDKGMQFGQFCAYDDKGDLFFDGLADGDKKNRLSELPSGGSSFIGLKTDFRIDSEASIQWDGRHLTALVYAKGGKAEIVQVAVKGARAMEIGVTPLAKPADIIAQYFIDNDTVVVPNQYFTNDERGNVLLYHYPSGGDPFFTVKKHVSIARGAAISSAADLR